LQLVLVPAGAGGVRALNAPNIDSLALVYLAGIKDGEVQSPDFQEPAAGNPLFC
jgi:hypothetical protein